MASVDVYLRLVIRSVYLLWEAVEAKKKLILIVVVGSAIEVNFNCLCISSHLE